MYTRFKVKLRDNKAGTQPNSRAKLDRGSIRMNDNVVFFKSTAFRSYAVPFFQIDNSESASMTDVQGALVTSQTIKNGASHKVRQMMC